MPVDIDVALQEAYASANAVELHTLEVRHPGFTQPIRLVLSHRNHTLTLEADAPLDPSTPVEFIGTSFGAEMPAVDENGQMRMRITIDNATGEIEDELGPAVQLPTVAEVTYRTFLDLDTSAPQLPILNMEVFDVSAGDMTIEVVVGFGDFSNKAFPREDYTRQRFPGLRR
ncbi:DUF1833 family protein [Methyloversatilis discipulorum]|uniref:DUF1833 family protein n=1 Tax=Methyloversatilis discipulorum TaxID=1119528 RepID=UPI0003611605|nr:DUF1833 family protein [Methyloversatilis discipulorum]